MWPLPHAVTRPSSVQPVPLPCPCHLVGDVWAHESVSHRARLWWLLCPPSALTCGSGELQVPRGGVWRWHCPAWLVAVPCRGSSPRDTALPVVQGWFIRRGSLCFPGVAQPFPRVPAVPGTRSSIGLCLGSLGAVGAVLRCLLSLLPAGGDAMAAASSSRARAGPPCEKSPLSVKGGSRCLAGIPPARNVCCVCSACTPGWDTSPGTAGAGLGRFPLPAAAGTWLRGPAGAALVLPWPRDGSRRPGPRPLGATSPALPLHGHCWPRGASSHLAPMPWGREVSVGTVTVLPPSEG